jgi:hypothetical protein
VTSAELRAFALTLEGMTEAGHHGKPDFRINNKIVVNLDEVESTITIKLDVVDQAALVARDPKAFTLPGGWAKHGWTTISLIHADDDEIEELVESVWRRAIQ